MENLTFKDWLLNTYDHDELQAIAEHGCANYAPSGMIYYHETRELYNRFADDIHEIVGEYVASMGEMPKTLIDNFDSATSFQNAMVWLATELVAYDLTSELME
jgi:hypothetical protein